MLTHNKLAYAIKITVIKHNASLSRSRTNPKKIYCVDHALVTSVKIKSKSNCLGRDRLLGTAWQAGRASQAEGK